MVIDGGNVYDEETDTTKTSKARVVLLSAPAFDALQRQKAHTFLQGEHVFHDPKTGAPWKYQTITDVRSFWKITLKQLGIRYRRPYNMRHTYATLGIMSGARPAFLANQLGHSLQVFFQVYAKWINSKDDRVEIAKLDQAIAQLPQYCPKAIHRGTNEDP
jgi:integrase